MMNNTTAISSQPQTVYGDRTVLITSLYIKIYRYYFPLGTSKTIFFNQIDHIVYYPYLNNDFIWGLDTDHLNNWFPLDQLRQYKKGYFQIYMKDHSIFRPCFSAADPSTALQVLTTLTQFKQPAINYANVNVNQMRDQEKCESSTQYQHSELNKLVQTQSKSKEDFINIAKIMQDIDVQTQTQRIPFKDITNHYLTNECQLDDDHIKQNPKHIPHTKKAKFISNDYSISSLSQSQSDPQLDYDLNFIEYQEQQFQDLMES